VLVPAESNYRKKCQRDPPVGVVVQVDVGGTPGPLSVVVQVVLEDGGVLLETLIHPQQPTAARIARARKPLVRFKIRI
jgi:hypothetical protein